MPNARAEKKKTRRRGYRLALWATAALAAFAIWRVAALYSDRVTGADVSDAKLVALGQRVYQENCARCHGANLEGQANWRQQRADGTFPAPPHDETGHTWHHPDQFLFAVTKKGAQAFAPPGFKSTMPGFGDSLSDEEIWAVIAYIKSRWPKAIQRRQAARTRQMKGN